MQVLSLSLKRASARNAPIPFFSEVDKQAALGELLRGRPRLVAVGALFGYGLSRESARRKLLEIGAVFSRHALVAHPTFEGEDGYVGWWELHGVAQTGALTPEEENIASGSFLVSSRVRAALARAGVVEKDGQPVMYRLGCYDADALQASIDGKWTTACNHAPRMSAFVSSTRTFRILLPRVRPRSRSTPSTPEEYVDQQERRARRKKSGTCPQCGSRFRRETTGRMRTTCGAKCRVAAWRAEKRRADRARELPPRRIGPSDVEDVEQKAAYHVTLAPR